MFEVMRRDGRPPTTVRLLQFTSTLVEAAEYDDGTPSMKTVTCFISVLWPEISPIIIFLDDEYSGAASQSSTAGQDQFGSKRSQTETCAN